MKFINWERKGNFKSSCTELLAMYHTLVTGLDHVICLHQELTNA